jgi:LPXTG-site transpeptidase (sortase) family protein
MLGKIQKTISPLLLVSAFLLGLAGGVYYHDEIIVWLYNYGLLHPPVSTSVEPTQSPSTEAKTTLQMATLPDPLPLIYSDTLEEEKLQDLLKEGAVVLPVGKGFGEPGNMVVTAHSSGTAAFGPYRFAFAKLSELNEGDEFKIATTKAIYTYKVFGKEIVWPTEVDKLPHDNRSTVTLVTCWPLWTNFKRLLVHGELVNINYHNAAPAS